MGLVLLGHAPQVIGWKLPAAVGSFGCFPKKQEGK